MAPAQNAGDAAQALIAAAVQIEVAVTTLSRAQSSNAQTRSIAEAIRSLETGLAAMRYALHGVGAQQSLLRAELSAKSTEVGQLLILLQRIGRNTTGQTVLHPEGPTASARAGMVLAMLTPKLNNQANELRAQLDSLNNLDVLHQQALANMNSALSELQRARAVLHDALKGRAEMPPNPGEDPNQLDRLLQVSDDLSALASGISAIPNDNSALAPIEFASLRGALLLPVVGTVRRYYGERDAAGLINPGVIIAAPALSLVVSPQAGHIRFAGDFLNYGLVVIIEPAPEYLQIIAGLGQLYVQKGDEVQMGDPIGLLGGLVPDSQEFLIEMSSNSGVHPVETLYIEVREQGDPVDPSGWFAGISQQGNEINE